MGRRGVRRPGRAGGRRRTWWPPGRRPARPRPPRPAARRPRRGRGSRPGRPWRRSGRGRSARNLQLMYTYCMQRAQASGRERAYRHLRETVLVDPAVQGTFLNEVDLAQAIGVSRTPVREALLLLVSEGQVEMVPKRGAYVPPLSGRQIRELME